MSEPPMRRPSTAFVLLAFALYLVSYPVPTQAQEAVDYSSCEKKEAKWTLNSKGENPCAVWGEVLSFCNNGHVVPAQRTDDVDGAYGPFNASYGPQAIPCQCSQVVYSLSSACGYCQGLDWTVESKWKKPCDDWATGGDLGGGSLDLASKIKEAGYVIPGWATDGKHTITNDAWNVTIAEAWRPPKSWAASHVKVVAGLSVAAFVILVLLGLSFWYYCCRRRRSRSAPASYRKSYAAPVARNVTPAAAPQSAVSTPGSSKEIELDQFAAPQVVRVPPPPPPQRNSLNSANRRSAPPPPPSHPSRKAGN